MASDLRKPPRRYGPIGLGLRAVLRFGSERVFPGRAAYARSLKRGATVVTRVEVPVADLPGDLEGLRIVQISDVHAGPFMDDAVLEPVLQLVAALRPDVFVLTGDFITTDRHDVERLGRCFSTIEAPLGRFAVFGNHDYRGREEARLVAALRRSGVTVLRNDCVRLRRGERDGEGVLLLAGLEDIEESHGSDLEGTLAGAHGDEHARVLLCHHPDVAKSLPAGAFDLVLSGHTHGGQIVLPVLGPLTARQDRHHLTGTWPLPGGGWHHVNRGVGVLVLPFRLGARPEVSCLVLRRAPSAEESGS